jgi:FkbM family methyltransferase
MASSLSIALGNFLYKNCFPIYKITYKSFKEKQDAFEISLMKKFIKSGDTVLDIGANIGFYAEILSRIVGEKGKVHCFEPDSINFNHLKSRSKHLPNVIANNKAVSDKTETIKIYTSKKLNVDHRTYKPDEYDQEIDIYAIAVDEYLQLQSSTSEINFIKMDIQGFEMSAVKGMTKTLQSPHLKCFLNFGPMVCEKQERVC